MADTIKRVTYYYTKTADNPGEGGRVLGALREQGVNLLAFHAFPEGGESQLDFFPEDEAKFLAAAVKAGMELSTKKTGFLVEGADRAGACSDLLHQLGSAGINVTALDAVRAGGGRYGALIWVSPDDVESAATALGVR